MKRFLEPKPIREIRRMFLLFPQLLPPQTRVIDLPIYISKPKRNAEEEECLRGYRERLFKVILQDGNEIRGKVWDDQKMRKEGKFFVLVYLDCPECQEKREYCVSLDFWLNMECPYCGTEIFSWMIPKAIVEEHRKRIEKLYGEEFPKVGSIQRPYPYI